MGKSARLFVIVCLVASGIGYMAGNARPFSSSRAIAADTCQTFTETGHMVCGDFLAYWQSHGGLAQQGFPVSDVFNEKSDTDSKTYQVQYFERAVFEAHPENAPPNNVLLSLLGAQKYKAKYPNGAQAGALPSVPPLVASPVASGLPQRKTSGALGVTLYAVSDPAPSGIILAPAAGNRCIAYDVQIDNQGSKPFYVGSSQSALKTTDNRQYTNSFGFCTNLEPDVAYGPLNPGDKIRGWVSFEIPQGAKIATFTWKGDGSDMVTFAFG